MSYSVLAACLAFRALTLAASQGQASQTTESDPLFDRISEQIADHGLTIKEESEGRNSSAKLIKVSPDGIAWVANREYVMPREVLFYEMRDLHHRYVATSRSSSTKYQISWIRILSVNSTEYGSGGQQAYAVEVNTQPIPAWTWTQVITWDTIIDPDSPGSTKSTSTSDTIKITQARLVFGSLTVANRLRDLLRTAAKKFGHTRT